MQQQTTSPPLRPQAGALADALQGWAERGEGSLAHRLAASLRMAVRTGALLDGARLPSERALADALAVSRATVTSALDALRADGTVVSRQGSGTVVGGGTGLAAVARARVASHFTAGGPGIDLATGNPPDASHLPDLQLTLADLVVDGEGPGTQPLGLPSLRAAVARYHTDHGLVTDADQVHITAGAHQATSLALRTAAGRSGAIAVEDPSYPGIFDLVDGLGARTIPLERDTAGPRPESLEAALRDHGATGVYLQSGAHNPTGRITPDSRLRALAEVLDGHDVTVIDDLALADLGFDRRPRPRLAQLCRRACVITVASVNKVTWGGLRIGWMRAPAPVIDQTMHVRLGYDLGPSVPSQIIVLRLLPELDALAEGRRATLERLVGQAIELLASEAPDWSIEPPEGGSVLWVRTPLPDTGPLVQLAARHGVRVAPGSIARPGRVADPHLRVCVDRPWPVVEEGIRRLVAAWRDLHATSPVLG